MAKTHVLNLRNGKLRIVLHLPVPDEVNLVGVSLQVALKNTRCCDTGQTILPVGDGQAGTISQDEKTAIENGQVVEVVHDVDPGRYAGMTSDEMKDGLDELFKELYWPRIMTVRKDLAYAGYVQDRAIELPPDPDAPAPEQA